MEDAVVYNLVFRNFKNFAVLMWERDFKSDIARTDIPRNVTYFY